MICWSFRTSRAGTYVELQRRATRCRHTIATFTPDILGIIL